MRTDSVEALGIRENKSLFQISIYCSLLPDGTAWKKHLTNFEIEIRICDADIRKTKWLATTTREWTDAWNNIELSLIDFTMCLWVSGCTIHACTVTTVQMCCHTRPSFPTDPLMVPNPFASGCTCRCSGYSVCIYSLSDTVGLNQAWLCTFVWHVIW